jgi:hypothetical protein
MSTIKLEAGYLPGLSADAVQWQVLPFEQNGQKLEISVPVLSATQMDALAQRVRQASNQYLKSLSVSAIIRIIDAATHRLLDRNDPYRQQADAVLPIISGYNADMVRLGLTGFLKTFRAPQLHRFIAEDFPNPKILDSFQPAPKGGAIRAHGPGLLLHSWAGNVPAIAMWSFVCGLLVKAGNIGKLPSAEPFFAGLFARLLVGIDPALKDCFAVVWWRGAGDEGADQLYSRVDTVVAYGSNESLTAIQRRLPVTTRFIPYGHKLGFGVVSATALDTLNAPQVARRAAWDVMRYDQQGCYSPHVFYVQRGGQVSPRLFADYVAAELQNLQHRYPRRCLDLAESSVVATWQQTMEWRTASMLSETRQDVLIEGAGATWGVAYTEEGTHALMPTAQQRCIVVAAVDQLDDVVHAVQAHPEFLQTAGVAASPEELYVLAEQLSAIGVTRISAIGAMSMPEAGWHHDGRFNLLDFVRMTEIEQSAEYAAEPFAAYEP